MQAVFLVKNIQQDWNPPFKTNIQQRELSVNEGDNFEEHDGNPVFRLVKIKGSQALLEYALHFSLKGYEHPGNKQIWINSGEEKSFSYLWGKDGTTKAVKLRNIMP